MKASRWISTALCALSWLTATTAHAGRSCETRAPTANAVQRSLDLAERTATQLDKSGAQVVVLARAGQDLSAYALRYSHIGLAYRDRPLQTATGAQRGVWRVVHKLNHCGTAQASIYRQGLAEFFMDDPHEYEAAWVVLEPAVQAGLITALRDNQRVALLDTPAYNMVAYPWSQSYQQSNQWVIETLAMTQDNSVHTRDRAQAWLRQKGYEPTTLRLSAFKRLGARIAAANVSFDDHPPERRFSDRIDTVTVDSVFAWLQRSRLGAPVQVLR